MNEGVIGGAYNFDGNDFIRIEETGNSLGGDGSWDEITVEFWIKATEPSGDETLLWKHERYDYSNGKPMFEGMPPTDPYGISYRIEFSAGRIALKFGKRILFWVAA